MRFPFRIGAAAALSVLAVGATIFSSQTIADDGDDELILYSGRSKSLVEPLIDMFRDTSGIDVKVKYGKSAELALTIQEEGRHGRADVFWSQDAGALAALAAGEFLSPLPAEVCERVPAELRHGDNTWIPTSGRARTLAYSPERTEGSELPHTIWDLTQPEWKGRVGWAPTNASFQAFVTALRKSEGDDRAETWLREMKANDAQSYPKNTAIIQAIAAGEVDLGLPNHYYLLRFKRTDPDYPVEQTSFDAGDVGNLVNVSGAGLLKSGKHPKAAVAFVSFLVSPEAQAFFAKEVMEYPIAFDSGDEGNLWPRNELVSRAPKVALTELADLDGTLALLRKVGLL